MTEKTKLRGRAWVTGASSGIGLAFAERLARDGFDTVLVARRAGLLGEIAERLRSETGTEVEVLVADLVDPSALEGVARRLAADSAARFLVNNAGAATFGSFPDADVAGELDLARLLVLPTVRLTHAALGPMRRAGSGAIVQISSRAALQPHSELATYSGAKAFVQAFTQALAGAPECRGVRLLSVCPGATRTELFAKAGIDPASIAPESWLEPAEVVEEALGALERGELVCVPSKGERGAWIRRVIPAAALRKVAGVVRRLARV